MAEYLDQSGLETLINLINNTFAKKSELPAPVFGVQLVISGSAPTGNANTLWINTAEQIMNYWNGSEWIPLGAVWK